MAQSRNRPSDDEIAQRIGEILEAIRTPEHADDIIEIRKIVRKNVPFFFRSYFAAYLLKDSLINGPRFGQRDQGRNRNQNQNQPKREQARDQGRKAPGVQEPKQKRDEPKRERQEEPKRDRPAEERKNERMAPLPEGVESATLFVSAGRKRHFYPRHLLDLFAGADIPRESIGEIRLFDNYTFVQILASDAQRAVDKLDGEAFKGRKLTVNFARKKEESSESASRREFGSESREFGSESREFGSKSREFGSKSRGARADGNSADSDVNGDRDIEREDSLSSGPDADVSDEAGTSGLLDDSESGSSSADDSFDDTLDEVSGDRTDDALDDDADLADEDDFANGGDLANSDDLDDDGDDLEDDDLDDDGDDLDDDGDDLDDDDDGVSEELEEIDDEDDSGDSGREDPTAGA